jgi:hypothetical protein
MNSGAEVLRNHAHDRRLHGVVVLVAGQLLNQVGPRLEVITITVLRKSTVRP